MARRMLTSVDGQSLPDFDRACRAIVHSAAEGVQRDVAVGGATVSTKTSYDGAKAADVFTSIDTAAQRQMANLADRLISPKVGQIGEEKGLRRPSTLDGPKVVLTFDPVDGTRKLIQALEAGRQLEHGEVSVMLGVQVDGEAVASYICDVAALVMYVRPMYGRFVYQVNPSGFTISTSLLTGLPRMDTATLLRYGDRPASLAAQRIANAFGMMEQGKDSIGLSVARIFTGEFGGMLRLAGMHVTPWDDTPVQAMCEQGDVLMLRIGPKRLTQISFGQLDEITRQDFDVLYVHRRYLSQLRQLTKVVTRG